MPFIQIDKPRAHVTRVMLNRPERMNAMAFDVMVPLRQALEEINFDNDTRVVILTGAGDGFCSGADLEDPGWLDIFNGLTMPGISRRAMKVYDDVILALRDLHQPVIGAINGAAIGGGFCMALATDIRIAAEGAYFRPAGINNGLTAAELGLSTVVGLIAGGLPALVRSKEGVEDDVNAGREIIDAHQVGPDDTVVGIAASGVTPYVRAALGRGQTLFPKALPMGRSGIANAR